MSSILKLYSKNNTLFKVHQYSYLIFKNYSSKIKSSPKGPSCMKVTICGAAGHVGQSLALMLKQSPFIDELYLYDIVSTCGFGMELGHIDTRCKVISACGLDYIGDALLGAKVVVITAGKRKNASDLFESNANVIVELTENIAKYAPKAMVAIVTNPINSLVPLASEVLRKCSVPNTNGLFGVTTLNTVRANTFVAEVQGIEPECVVVPCIGGNTSKTVIPVLSQAQPCKEFSNEELETITRRVQRACAKSPKSAALSSAFATTRFVISLVKALMGKPGIIECAYVKSDIHSQVKFLATPLQLGLSGIQKNLGIPDLTAYEGCLFEQAIPILAEDIKKGLEYCKDPLEDNDCERVMQEVKEKEPAPVCPC